MWVRNETECMGTKKSQDTLFFLHSCLRTENVGQVIRVHVDFLGDGGAAQFRIGKMRTDMNILVY